MQPGSFPRLSVSLPPKALAAVSIAVGLAATGMSAQAAPITTAPQVRTFVAELSRTGPFSVPASASRALTFNEFDGSLGTLQQVVFRWVTELNATLDDQTAIGGPVASINASVGAQVIGLGGLFSRGFTASVPEDEERATIAQSVTGTRTYTAPADLTYFIGTGTFSTEVALDVTVESDNNSASMTASWQATPRTGLFSVEYVYEPAGVRLPEPGVMLLGTAAALAFGFAGWRRRGTTH